MAALGWLLNLGYGGGATAATATISLSSLTEVEVQQGWQELYITLDIATWVSGSTFDSARQAIINGLDGSGTETHGWDAEVKANIELPAVKRLSDTVVKIILPPAPAFDISSNETVSVTIPASANSSAAAISATTSITVSTVALEGTAIQNTNATTDVPNNYEQDDRTGFRVLPGGLVRDGQSGNYVRPKSRDERHPQEYIRAVPDTGKGSVSPERDDSFLADGEVTVDDL